MSQKHTKMSENCLNRRQVLQRGAGVVAATVATTTASNGQGAEPVEVSSRIKQSVVFWCFNMAGEKWSVEKTCQVAKQLGCVSVELTDPRDWSLLKKYDLVCAIAPNGMPGAPFMRGFNNPAYHAEVIHRTKAAIDACADAEMPNVIAFTGYKWRDANDPGSGEISAEEGAEHCVASLQEVISHAEKREVTVCLEHPNTRDHSHPMKGHPGYQGDDLDYVADIIRRVDSPRLKLLFDVYHVQVMHGDVIRRLDENRDIIGHVHTAGNPGRGELDDTQEIQYSAVMRQLLELDYQGYVGQEFIPTRDPFSGLREAVAQCDV